MEIVVDLTRIQELLALPTDVLMYRFLVTFGWIPVAITLLWGFKEIWMSYIRKDWAKKNAKFLLLAIDIPRENEQSLKAVENLFSYLSGAHGSINLIEKYWEGKWQLYFSFEIVSIEGYTQFLIHTPVDFRDLVESAVYSQYPDAEITEVDDYTQGYPTSFPDDKYDIWGGEFIMSDNHMYPIRTYREFEDPNDPAKVIFKDPIATLMDLNSSLGKGEQLWYQILVIPTDFAWVKEGEKLISQVLGEKVAPQKNIADKLVDGILSFIESISETVYSIWGDIEAKEDPKEDSFKMMNLKPKAKKQIEAIENKVAKMGFETKIRMIYLAEKEVMKKPKVANGFVGFMKQFGDNSLNSLKPDTERTVTTTSYFLKENRLNDRKTKAMRAYKDRDDSVGKAPKIMNVEELATIWHFPLSSAVRAPLIQSAPGRKAEPPMGLPFSQEEIPEAPSRESVPDFFTEEESPVRRNSQEEEEEPNFSQSDLGKPPDNLPRI